MKLRSVILSLVILFSIQINAQETAIYTDIHKAYKAGIEFYSQGLFGQAQHAMGQVLVLQETVSQPLSPNQLQTAELRYAQSAIRLKKEEGERLILDFIRKYSSTGAANMARLEMGNYYFDSGNFGEALAYYQQVNDLNISNDAIAEMRFKKGYAFFVKKKYKNAQRTFKTIKDVPNDDYYEPANYYYAITLFFEDNYDEALKSFKRIEKSKKYSRVIPYYLSQIMFAEGRYDELIAYGEEQLADSGIKYRNQIGQLVGQAYFEKKQFNKALPYLEEFVESSNRLREEDLYQVAYTQYRVGKYNDAIKNFEELNAVKSALGQNALYNLADSHLKVGDKLSARNAFKAASQLNFDKEIQAEAEFNYAKLSYELNDDKEAIRVLQTIPATSTHYTEAQELLSEVFLSTRNYAAALETLDRIPNKSLALKEAYQKVAYYRAVQLYNDGQQVAAKAMFVKSLNTFPIDAKTKALAYYWIGEINHANKDYDSSIRDYNQFLAIAKAVNDLPDESSVYMGNYAQGYNYLKKEDYVTAGKYFYQAAAGIKQNINFIKDNYIKTQVLPDALLRNGDCYFQRNKYAEALINYDQVINARFTGFDYALYQKGTILGLQGKTVDKILALETLSEKNRNSDYADDALLALGKTYIQINRPDQASDMLTRLINRYKGKSNLINRALLELGLIAYNENQLEKSLNYYKQVFTNNPDSEEARDALKGIEEIYTELGEPEKYFAFLESVPGYKITSAGKDSITYRTAENQYRKGDWSKAITGFSNYLRQFPSGRNALEAHYRRGESYYNIKDYGNALIDYEYVINRGNSRYYSRSIRRAALIAYNFSEDFSKSYNYFEKLEEVANNSDEQFDAQLGGLRSAYRSDNGAGVEKMANKILVNPKSTNKEKAEANYYLGKVMLNAQRLDKAKTAFENVMAFIDNVWAAEAHYQVAYIEYLNRNLDKSQEIALETGSVYPDYDYWFAKSIILLADIFAEKGDTFNAKASLQSLIDNYTGNDDILPTAQAKLKAIVEAESNNSRLAQPIDPEGDLELDPDTGGN